MVLHWPQITYIILTAIGIGMNITNGDTKKLLTESIASAIIITILYYGGFFSGCTV